MMTFEIFVAEKSSFSGYDFPDLRKPTKRLNHMSETIGIIVLAAGKGTRMKIDTPKALAPALGRPLLDYVIDSALKFSSEVKLNAEVGIVIGHRKEMLENWHHSQPQKSSLKLAWQKEQNGTADALKACFNDQPQFWDHTYTVVAMADTPLLSSEELEILFRELKSRPDLVGVAATFMARDPKGYGRIVNGGNGFHIVEEKDATEEERKISEVNSGVYILRTSHIKDVLGSIGNKNKSGEFYLTDLFQDSYKVKAVHFSSETPFLGINTLAQLSEVNDHLLAKKILKLQTDGVMFLNTASVYLDFNVTVGCGSVIFPSVTIVGNTTVGQNVRIETGTFIKNSVVEDNVELLASSYLEDAQVHSDCSIGPMARLRPGTIVGTHAKVGNFVEIKKATLGPGAKVSHLSYVGDAEIGDNTNIGCGFITCNYDGANKHKTKIGKNTFIGSDCQIIAPIEIGDDAFVAAGSTITKSVPNGGFAIARTQQVTKEGAAKRFLKVKKN